MYAKNSKYLGAAATLVLAVLLTVLSQWGIKIPNPVLIFSFFIVLSAYNGGYLPGLISASISFAFILIDWSSPEGLFQYSGRDIYRICIFLATMPGMSILVARLHKSNQESILKLSTYAEELKNSEDRLLRAEHVAGTGNWEVDLESGELLTSKGARHIYGIDDSFALFTNVQGIPLPEYRQLLDELLEGLVSGEDTYSVEFKICRPIDGKVVDIYSRATLDQEKNRIFGIVQDITSQKQTESELMDALEKADSANKAKTLFLANMSHEIRTPLNGILGMLQLLRDRTADTAQTEYIDAAIHSSKRLEILLSDILDISRIEAGKILVSRRSFRLDDLRAAARDLFRQKVEENNIEFTFRLAEGVPDWLVGDEGKVRQIIFNLVTNALKFTHDGTVSVDASVLAADADACRLLFIVADTGSGIADDQIDYIFESFAQGDSSFVKKVQGAGLGLSIVRRLVKLLGGSLCVTSELGTGTTMYVSLPFGQCARDSIPAQDAPCSEAVCPATSANILVADDDRILRIVSERFLTDAGHNVVCAGSGTEALDKLLDADFDMVLMDIQMPEMDGVEATRTIRTDDRYSRFRNLPVLAVTAYAMSGDQEAFMNEGFDGYIAKPFDKKKLLQLVQDVMNRKTSCTPSC